MVSVATNIAFFGHVDSGKSTTIGRILVDMDSIPIKQHKIDWNSKKFNYAWITDELDEERDRGITMDAVFRTFKYNEIFFNVIDTPGHMDYLSNLIKVLCQADIAIYIVDASIGSFESALGSNNNIIDNIHGKNSFQPYNLNHSTLSTHIMLAKAFGLSNIIILLNKMDTISYDKNRFDFISTSIRDCLLKYHYKEDSFVIIPISAIEGVNLVNNSNTLPCLLSKWYNGPNLMDTLIIYHQINENNVTSEKRHEKQLFISIFDFYSEKTNSVTIVGKVIQGTLLSNSKLVVYPSSQNFIVKDIYCNNSNLPAYKAISNDIVIFSFNGCDIDQIRRGNIVTTIDCPLIKHTKIICSIITMDIIKPITPGMHILFHACNITTNAAISKLIQLTTKSEPINHPLIIRSYSRAKIEITFETPCCVQEFTHCKPLGRFCLTSNIGIIAVGIVDNILV